MRKQSETLRLQTLCEEERARCYRIFAIILGNWQPAQFDVSARQKSSNIWRSPCCW